MGARSGSPDFDQRGVARPAGDATDIGAYEFAPPVPVISQATSEGRWGGSQPAWVGSQTLIVNGTGFYPDSVLRVNGQALQTYFESPTELRAIVGDLMIKGLTSFSATVFTPGGGESDAVQVAIPACPPSQDPPAKTPIRVPPLPVWSGPTYGDPPPKDPPVNGQPTQPPSQASTPNGNFVAAVYHDLFQRAPDVQGLSFWTDFLDHGGARAQAVSALLASREYLVDQVESLFQNYLHRSADSSAADYFASFLAAGGTPEQIAATLSASPEYLQAHGDSAGGFVDALFQDELGRGADPAARAFFEQELSAGATRRQVAAQILSSDEYRQDLVNDAYIQFLGRSADAAALDRFTAGLGGGMSEQQLIEQIAASDEFFKNASR